MSSLYSVLPPQTYTLEEFVLRAEALKTEDQNVFHQFILTGQFNGKNAHQAVLDPIRNVLEDNHFISIARDYDSLLTFQSHIVVDCPISIYPIPNPVEVLTTSIHLQYPVVKGDVSYAQKKHTRAEYIFVDINIDTCTPNSKLQIRILESTPYDSHFFPLSRGPETG
jgi:hypothetical protein